MQILDGKLLDSILEDTNYLICTGIAKSLSRFNSYLERIMVYQYIVAPLQGAQTFGNIAVYGSIT